MLEHISADYVIVEGMKNFPLPKILCASSEDDLQKLMDETTFAISGLIANKLDSFQGIKILILITKLLN